jgi:hypothetical protein
LIRAEDLYNFGKYDFMLVVLYSIIENKIYAKLTEKRNLDRKLLDHNLMIDIAIKDGILTSNQLEQ